MIPIERRERWSPGGPLGSEANGNTGLDFVLFLRVKCLLFRVQFCERVDWRSFDKVGTTRVTLVVNFIGFLIISFIYNHNFFRKFYNIFQKGYETRLIEKYGYCSGESIGFLRMLKKKI